MRVRKVRRARHRQIYTMAGIRSGIVGRTGRGDRTHRNALKGKAGRKDMNNNDRQ